MNNTKIKEDPSSLLIGSEAIIYKMFVAAATNQALKIFQVEKRKRSIVILYLFILNNMI